MAHNLSQAGESNESIRCCLPYAPRSRDVHLGRRWGRGGMLLRGGWRVLLAGVLALAIATGCATNPATGQRQFDVLTTEREVEIGEEAAPQFIEEFGGEIPSETVAEYVSEIGHKLAAVSERPNLPWEFTVVDSDTINAFALPGGKVFISRGLLAQMENEAQLAGVLGHEIGHVTAEHIDQRLGRQVVVSLGLAGLGAAASASDEDWLRVLGVGAQVGAGVTLLKFSRSEEIQSDELGMRYMAEAGYNPVGQLQVMQILQRESQQQGAPIEFLSTHPLPQTRIDEIEDIIQAQYPGYDDPSRYTFAHDRFQAIVPPALAELPPPKHSRQQASQPQQQ